MSIDQDKRKISLEDRMKHIVNEADVINTMIQLLMADLQHYIKDKNGISNKENKE